MKHTLILFLFLLTSCTGMTQPWGDPRNILKGKRRYEDGIFGPKKEKPHDVPFENIKLFQKTNNFDESKYNCKSLNTTEANLNTEIEGKNAQYDNMIEQLLSKTEKRNGNVVIIISETKMKLRAKVLQCDLELLKERE